MQRRWEEQLSAVTLLLAGPEPRQHQPSGATRQQDRHRVLLYFGAKPVIETACQSANCRLQHPGRPGDTPVCACAIWQDLTRRACRWRGWATSQHDRYSRPKKMRDCRRSATSSSIMSRSATALTDEILHDVIFDAGRVALYCRTVGQSTFAKLSDEIRP